MKKMVMISYNEAIDDEVMDLIGHCGLKGYTKTTGVFGRGAASGAHLGSDIWPGRNNLLYVACEAEKAQELLLGVKRLRETLGREGVKAFLLPIEESA